MKTSFCLSLHALAGLVAGLRTSAKPLGPYVITKETKLETLHVDKFLYGSDFYLCPRVSRNGVWKAPRVYANYELREALKKPVVKFGMTATAFFDPNKGDKSCTKDLPLYIALLGNHVKEMWFYFQYDAKTKTAEYCHFAHYFEAPFDRDNRFKPETLCNGFDVPKEFTVTQVVPKKAPVRIEKTVPLKVTKFLAFPDRLDCSRDFMEPLRIEGAAVKAATKAAHYVGTKITKKDVNFGDVDTDPTLPHYVGYIGKKPEARFLFSFNAKTGEANFLGATATGAIEAIVDAPYLCWEQKGENWNYDWPADT